MGALQGGRHGQRRWPFVLGGFCSVKQMMEAVTELEREWRMPSSPGPGPSGALRLRPSPQCGGPRSLHRGPKTGPLLKLPGTAAFRHHRYRDPNVRTGGCSNAGERRHSR